MTVEVHVEWNGETRRVGSLHLAGRGPAVTFVYADEWLRTPDAFALDPTNLPLRAGAHHSPGLFGAFQDCGPDRWGRLLIERAVRREVLPRQAYQDLDFVLALDDASRIGALRFRRSPDSPFLAASGGRIPPLVQLAALLNAAAAVQGETETAQDLRFLLGQGSPLGGARPKSAIRLADGTLAIAKFPKPDDRRDIAGGEVLALALARRAGLRVADHQLVRVEGGSVSVITRFDRQGAHRVPFLSAHTLLGLSPGAAGAYTLMADAIRRFGDDVTAELRELWRRLVFSLLASNFDDHLRNHGFLMVAPGRWALSPAYDLNPVPEMERALTPKTPITEEGAEPSLAGALAAAPRFGLRPDAARSDLAGLVVAVGEWRAVGRQLGLKAGTLAAYESAFEHPLMEEARRLSGA